MTKMESMLEILLWILIVIFIFYVCNTVCFVRTAASLFISFLVASAFIFLIYQSLFGEIVFLLSCTIGLIYAIFRAVRDKRDDTPKGKDPPTPMDSSPHSSETSYASSETTASGLSSVSALGKVKPFSPMLRVGI